MSYEVALKEETPRRSSPVGRSSSGGRDRHWRSLPPRKGHCDHNRGPTAKPVEFSSRSGSGAAMPSTCHQHAGCRINNVRTSTYRTGGQISISIWGATTLIGAWLVVPRISATRQAFASGVCSPYVDRPFSILTCPGERRVGLSLNTPLKGSASFPALPMVISLIHSFALRCSTSDGASTSRTTVYSSHGIVLPSFGPELMLSQKI